MLFAPFALITIYKKLGLNTPYKGGDKSSRAEGTGSMI